ncbi:Uncharacterized protein YNL011C [Linum perenne]
MAEGSSSIAKTASLLLLQSPNNIPSSSTSSKATVSQTTQCANSSSVSSPRPNQPSLLVFSGGTAFNGVVEELKKLTTRVAHVLPVSDDGGSTAEIVRVLGGPAVGDIRSRCLRLSDQSTVEALAVRRLLGHRLPLDAQEAKSEWYSIVEGDHGLWNGLSRPYSETIRAFLVYFQNEDGTIMRGQNEISHPTISSMHPIDKGCCSALPSRIKRVFYMSSEGGNSLHEVFPSVNATVLDQLSKVDCVVYAMGSLFTSICPSLVLLLNGTHDRETAGFSCSCFVTAVTDALNRRYGDPHNCLENPVKHLPTFSSSALQNRPTGGGLHPFPEPVGPRQRLT